MLHPLLAAQACGLVAERPYRRTSDESHQPRDAYGETPDGRAALGLRTANNKTMTIQLCAGLAVFVCDNLAFRGDMIALRRKHTSGLNLRAELAGAVLRFQEHFGRLSGEVELLKGRMLPDIQAKALIHDAFAEGLMPVRFLPEVSR